MRTTFAIAAVMMVALWASAGFAEDQKQAQMPPMGPPEQMKDVAFLEGSWNVDMQWRDEKDPEKWNEEKGSCTYKPILGGSALEMTYKGDMMNMPFQGLMIMSYDRDKHEWQSMWLDNMGAKMSFYTGDMKDGKMSLTGEEMWQGQNFLSRMSTFNHTDKSFDWTMESSFDGGKTWMVMGTAKYTKI